LHTVEGHRKRGLAKVIVSEISQQFVREFPHCSLSTGPIYIHADCEAYNEAAVKAFNRLGFDHTHFVTWLGVEIDFERETITS
jgi:predicted GNAT family acetyltransferase